MQLSVQGNGPLKLQSQNSSGLFDLFEKWDRMFMVLNYGDVLIYKSRKDSSPCFQFLVADILSVSIERNGRINASLSEVLGNDFHHLLLKTFQRDEIRLK